MTDLKDIEKAKHSPQQWTCLRLFLIVIVTVVGGSCLLFIILTQAFWSGYVKISLDAEFIPTAEYLLINPQPTPQRENVGHLYVDEEICISFVDSLDEKQNISFLWSEIFINRQRVGRGDMSMSMYTSLPGIWEFCIENTLESGLHIIEFKARGDRRQLLFSQEWAIEIE